MYISGLMIHLHAAFAFCTVDAIVTWGATVSTVSSVGKKAVIRAAGEFDIHAVRVVIFPTGRTKAVTPQLPPRHHLSEPGCHKEDNASMQSHYAKLPSWSVSQRSY